MRVRGIAINGGLTDAAHSRVSYDVAKTEATENSRNNEWNVNNDGNTNANNKYNRNNAVAVAAPVAYPRFQFGMLLAFEDCLRGKRTSPQCIEYISNQENDVETLTRELYFFTWHPGKSRCFMVKHPKLRECFAAAFRDRIIHHWICSRLLPIFEARCHKLGDVSHACRKGYGTKTAIRQVEQDIATVSNNLTRNAWIYKGDIVGFFMSIDQRKLLGMLRELIENEYHETDKDWLLYATKLCAIHRPEMDCEVVSPITMWDKLPKHKSLFYGDKHHGEAIGNLTTQHFAGYYLSFLDEFVSNLFKGKNYSYTRSVDDFVIICDDKSFLKHSIREIDTFLIDKLSLKTHSESVYFQPASHGVKFLGAWIKYHRTYTINRTVNRFTHLVREMFYDCENRGLSAAEVDSWSSTINSYLGMLRATRSYKIRRIIVDKAPAEFFSYFYVVDMNKIVPRKQYRLCS